MNDLARIFANPNFNQITSNNNTNSSSSTTNSNIPQSSQNPTDYALPAIQNQLNNMQRVLINMHRNQNQQQPPPVLLSNPHIPQLSLSFDKPQRGLDTVCVDTVQKLAVVSRMKDIAVGAVVSSELRGVLRSLNTDTNKELRKKLEGT